MRVHGSCKVELGSVLSQSWSAFDLTPVMSQTRVMSCLSMLEPFGLLKTVILGWAWTVLYEGDTTHSLCAAATHTELHASLPEMTTSSVIAAYARLHSCSWLPLAATWISEGCMSASQGYC